MGHLLLLPDVCEPPSAKPKAGNKRRRDAQTAPPAAAAAAAATAAPAASDCASDEVRSEIGSGLGDGEEPEWPRHQPPAADENDAGPQPETLRRASAPTWDRVIGRDSSSHSTGASSQGSMSSFRGMRSASGSRTASKRSRTAVVIGWGPLQDDELL